MTSGIEISPSMFTNFPLSVLRIPIWGGRECREPSTVMWKSRVLWSTAWSASGLSSRVSRGATNRGWSRDWSTWREVRPARLPAQPRPQQARVVVVRSRVPTLRLHERSAVVRSTYNNILDSIFWIINYVQKFKGK